MSEGLKFDPDWVVKPGEMLAEEMLASNLSVRIVARICRVAPEVIDGVLDGSHPIDKQIAYGLARLGVSAQFWLNLQKIYDDGIARGKKVL